MPASEGPGSEGAAAEAIRAAEAALAQQNSVTAQVDLAVVTAVLNAHTAHADRAGALDSLQREIESAVATRTTLNTAAGAREFQRYLIDKLGDIRTVVEEADLDDTSKASLAVALAALYASAGSGGNAAETPGNPAASAVSPPPSPGRPTASPPDSSFPAAIGSGLDPGLSDFGPLTFPDPEPVSAPLGDTTGTTPPPAAPPTGQPAPVAPALPSVPALPSLGGGPSGVSPWDGLGSLPALTGLADPTDEPRSDATDTPAEEGHEPEDNEEQRAGVPTDEPLPEPLPPFAGVIATAVAGTPIAEAFHQQGITIPGPGTPVSAPLAPDDVVPGDLAMFDDRHALALGNGKVLLDDQIQPIDAVARPGFVGWQHPPQPDRIADSDQ